MRISDWSSDVCSSDLKGKGPGNMDWVIGYDAKADKFLDVNVKYKLGGNGNHFVQVGQFKQPNSMEESSSTTNNDFISKSMATHTHPVARHLGAGSGFGPDNRSTNEIGNDAGQV